MVKGKKAKTVVSLSELHKGKIASVIEEREKIKRERANLLDLKRDLRALKRANKTNSSSVTSTQINFLEAQIEGLTQKIATMNARNNLSDYTSQTNEIVNDLFNNNGIPDAQDSRYTTFARGGASNIMTNPMFVTVKPKKTEKTSKRFLTKQGLLQEYQLAQNPETAKDISDTQCLDPQCDGTMIIQQDNEYSMCDTCSVIGPVTVTLDAHVTNTLTCTKGGYERSSHLLDILNSVQGKKTAELGDVIEEITDKLADQRIKIDSLTIKKLKVIMKELGHSTKYNYAHYIHHCITGKKPLQFSRSDEETIMTMFGKVQGPFEACCPSNRTNFPAYNFILRKFCELLDLPEHAELFPKLKNTEGLVKYDKIWKGVCEITGWEYRKSI